MAETWRAPPTAAVYASAPPTSPAASACACDINGCPNLFSVWNRGSNGCPNLSSVGNRDINGCPYLLAIRFVGYEVGKHESTEFR